MSLMRSGRIGGETVMHPITVVNNISSGISVSDTDVIE